MKGFLQRAGRAAPTSCGRRLEISEDAFGELTESEVSSRIDDLRSQMSAQGYLFFRGFSQCSAVENARNCLLKALETEAALDPRYPLEDGIAASEFVSDLRAEGGNYPAIHRLPREAGIERLFARLLGEEVRCVDHTWIRVKSPGRSTAPHCDIVYHQRGSPRINTIWMPLGDVPMELGPLMLLEGSNRSERLRNGYCNLDVSAGRNGTRLRFRHGGFFRGGQYTKKPDAAQRELGGRWLTADFRSGDMVIFSSFTLHGALDNQSKRLRLSLDARYQPARDPTDPRWPTD